MHQEPLRQAVALLFLLIVLQQTVSGAGVAAAPETVHNRVLTLAQTGSCQTPLQFQCRVVDEHGVSFNPTAVALVGDDIYCLDPAHIYGAAKARLLLSRSHQLNFKCLGPDKPIIGKIPMQEFLTFAYAPDRRSLVVLDKSGDVYEFGLDHQSWQVLRPNAPMGSPDPEYIDMAVSGANVCLLDPERNQVWRYPATSRRYFKDVMPWRVKPGDISVANGIGIAYDGGAWVLRADGEISHFKADAEKGMAAHVPFRWQRFPRMRPSRISTAPGCPLFVVERENNRVVAIDKTSGAARQYLFPSGSDLRGMIPFADHFLIADGDRLVSRDLAHFDSPLAKPAPRLIDARLLGLVMPLKGAHLPRHPGVWAGARRAYRFGVHHGTDFFDDPGMGTHVHMDTPIHAADAGKVLRADWQFQDLSASKYAAVIYQCQSQHICSESSEDFLRGCQVWLDHGKGLVTRYAHLDRVQNGLRAGDRVAQGQLIGFVGVSGTGENLPGRAKHPHLHFEIFLDGKYLGYGLTPAETIGVYEDIFGVGS
jgi:murein DD-endopeptidase MepM/ murein hydrolase activator NlpD